MAAADPPRGPDPARAGRTVALSVLILVQAGAALFFLVDIAEDLAGLHLLPVGLHYAIEAVAVVALILGIGLAALEIRRVTARQARMEAQLRAASGAFHELLHEHFDAWALTPAERDVALLTIKGLSIAEIARARATRTGTVKAQSAAVYAKAGVSGRAQLLSLFIDELMDDRLRPAAAPPGG